MIEILVKLLIVSFLLNVLWEFLHSRLYDTCLKMSWQECSPMLVWASVKDGFWIGIFFSVSVLVFGNALLFDNPLQILTFVVLCLGFSFVDEKISIAKKRWKYSTKMPLILGVGVSPLIELAVTGVLALLILL